MRTPLFPTYAFFLFVAQLTLPLPAQPTTPPTTRPAVTTFVVDGDVPHALKMSVADIAAMAHRDVKVKDRRGQEIAYSGVSLADLVRQAGVAMNAAQMRAEFLHFVLIAKGADGYRVTFSLAELNDDLAGRPVFLVDHRDGKPLDQNEGPFRIVVPGDASPARWVRQAASLTIKDLQRD